MDKSKKNGEPSAVGPERPIALEFTEKEFLCCAFFWLYVVKDGNNLGVGKRMRDIIDSSPNLKERYDAMCAGADLQRVQIRRVRELYAVLR